MLKSKTHPAPRSRERIAEDVVMAVAEAKGVSPLELRPPLATVIDPDALNRIVASMDSLPDQQNSSIEFRYSGYTVRITEDGVVTTTDPHPGDG